jgi:hypothetical protein
MSNDGMINEWWIEMDAERRVIGW